MTDSDCFRKIFDLPVSHGAVARCSGPFVHVFPNPVPFQSGNGCQGNEYSPKSVCRSLRLRATDWTSAGKCKPLAREARLWPKVRRSQAAFGAAAGRRHTLVADASVKTRERCQRLTPRKFGRRFTARRPGIRTCLTNTV